VCIQGRPREESRKGTDVKDGRMGDSSGFKWGGEGHEFMKVVKEREIEIREGGKHEGRRVEEILDVPFSWKLIRQTIEGVY